LNTTPETKKQHLMGGEERGTEGKKGRRREKGGEDKHVICILESFNHLIITLLSIYFSGRDLLATNEYKTS